MRKTNFALRLQPSLLEEAHKLAESEGVALNEFINVAVAEKRSALRTEDYFSKRVARANIPNALKILRRAGAGNPLDIETHELGLDMAERYGFSIYDGLIVAAAVRAGCAILYTEDLRQGQMIEKLQIRKPFAGS